MLKIHGNICPVEVFLSFHYSGGSLNDFNWDDPSPRRLFHLSSVSFVLSELAFWIHLLRYHMLMVYLNILRKSKFHSGESRILSCTSKGKKKKGKKKPTCWTRTKSSSPLVCQQTKLYWSQFQCHRCNLLQSFTAKQADIFKCWVDPFLGCSGTLIHFFYLCWVCAWQHFISDIYLPRAFCYSIQMQMIL